MPKRRFLPNITPYGGPDWWSISYDCAAFVLRFVAENPGYKKFFRYTQSPGELFFQTIILNSRWAERVENYDAYINWSRAKRTEISLSEPDMLPDSDFNYRYADWTGEVTGLRETPAVLDERDWDRIKRSNCHFARKFDPCRSATLLDRIDREILGLDISPN